MPNYRRYYQTGGTYFFTLVTDQRQPILTQPNSIPMLRLAFHKTLKKYPCQLSDIVVLPDHVHFILELPESDCDFSLRIRLIKSYFSKSINTATNDQDKVSVWQKRFWEHCIRDKNDLNRHRDYLYFNPVKHGLVDVPADWPYSSFKRAVENGFYEENWGRQEPKSIFGFEFGE
ncbi:transposase [Porticoccus sp. W117]|uniref:REP-associated tyrosine transposase n=1 Tax=Porticoccus sp. W117 TaxID=3054777 RepID=UPI00259AC7F3|nr:transposase [Porticoccus sp. W117]MDM3871765.1 transposase [Porticoccus sp. W117]